MTGVSTSFYFYAFFQMFAAIYNSKRLNDKVAHIYLCLGFGVFFFKGEVKNSHGIDLSEKHMIFSRLTFLC